VDVLNDAGLIGAYGANIDKVLSIILRRYFLSWLLRRSYFFQGKSWKKRST